MLLPFLPQLNERKIILASGSYCRREVLKTLGLQFEVIPSKFAETLDKANFPDTLDYLRTNTRGKLDDSVETFENEGKEYDLLIVADTIIVHDGVILEKPRDDEHAKEMLRAYSGKDHKCHTCVIIYDNTGDQPREKMFITTTDVYWTTLNEEMIDAYVKSGEPFGKAGGYGIQATAGSFIHKIDGCYFNVWGFPMHDFASNLYNFYILKRDD